MQGMHTKVQGLHVVQGGVVDQTQEGPSGWLCASAEARWAGQGRGRGVFALRDIPAGSLVCIFGGRVIDWASLQALSEDERRMALQVDDELFIVSTREGPSDWVNHSCEPNTGMSGQISLVAMRRILAGEEITFDYAMTDSVPYDEFDCACGASLCRTRVSATDWLLPDLQRRYGGHFSPYLERRLVRHTRRPRRRANA